MNAFTILGVPVVKTRANSLLEQIQRWLHHSGQHHLVTLNPEIIMAAQADQQFFKLLQGTHNIPDGSGLLFAARFLGQPLSERVTGVDVTETLLKTLQGPGQSVYLLGARPGVAAAVASRFIKQNPDLVIAGIESGFRHWQRVPHDTVIKRIQKAKPRLLLVAFGAPKQEQWLNEHLPELTTVRVAIGVGGAFDLLAGVVRRAPRVMRALRLEWLWRLWLEPWRWPRIITATWHFSRAVVRSRHNAPRHD